MEVTWLKQVLQQVWQSWHHAPRWERWDHFTVSPDCHQSSSERRRLQPLHTSAARRGDIGPSLLGSSSGLPLLARFGVPACDAFSVTVDRRMLLTSGLFFAPAATLPAGLVMLCSMFSSALSSSIAGLGGAGLHKPCCTTQGWAKGHWCCCERVDTHDQNCCGHLRNVLLQSTPPQSWRSARQNPLWLSTCSFVVAHLAPMRGSRLAMCCLLRCLYFVCQKFAQRPMSIILRSCYHVLAAQHRPHPQLPTRPG